jgi:septal ring factor EnvC (AmiA/AmiB activator)
VYYTPFKVDELSAGELAEQILVAQEELARQERLQSEAHSRRSDLVRELQRLEEECWDIDADAKELLRTISQLKKLYSDKKACRGE